MTVIKQDDYPWFLTDEAKYIRSPLPTLWAEFASPGKASRVKLWTPLIRVGIRGVHCVLGEGVLGVVVVAAAGLGKASGEHVADGQKRDQLHGVVGIEEVGAFSVRIAQGDRGRDRRDDGDDVDDQLSCFEC